MPVAGLVDDWHNTALGTFLLTRAAAIQLELRVLRDEHMMAKAKDNSEKVESINASIVQFNVRRDELITYKAFMKCLISPLPNLIDPFCAIIP